MKATINKSEKVVKVSESGLFSLVFVPDKKQPAGTAVIVKAGTGS